MSKRRSRHREPQQPPKPPEPIVGELVRQSEQPLELLNDPSHVRGEARTLAKYLQLGVVPEEKAKRYLARTYELLEQETSVREFTALSKVICALAKLGLDIEKLDTPKKHQHAHLHAAIDPSGTPISSIFAKLRASAAHGGVGENEP